MRSILVSLVLVAFFASLATASPISLNLSQPDGSNFSLSTNEFAPGGEQLSMGATINVESRRVEGASISTWTEQDDPTRFRGVMTVYGWEGGSMSPSDYHSLSMNFGGMYLSIGEEVQEIPMVNNVPMLYSSLWANVAVENGMFTHANFNQNFYPQDNGEIWFQDAFWFYGAREGNNLQAFSMTQSLSIPEPVTLGLIGLAVPLLALRRR